MIPGVCLCDAAAHSIDQLVAFYRSKIRILFPSFINHVAGVCADHLESEQQGERRSALFPAAFCLREL